jgi:hypothetical protein
MDGGSVYGVDIFTAVQRCREEVDDDSKINVDIIICQEMPHLKKWEKEHNTIFNLLRHREIKNYHKTTGDLFKFIHGFPEVNFRYLVLPSKGFPGNPLNANNSTVTWPVQMMGR